LLEGVFLFFVSSQGACATPIAEVLKLKHGKVADGFCVEFLEKNGMQKRSMQPYE